MLNDGWQLEAEPPSAGGDQWMVFEVAGREYAVAKDAVQGDVIAPPPARLPGGPSYLRGVAMVFGSAVPVIALAERVADDGAASPDTARRLLVVEHAGEQFGLLIEQVVDELRFDWVDGAAEAGRLYTTFAVGERTIRRLELSAVCAIAPEPGSEP